MEKERCAVTLTASSGVLLDFGGRGCAVDALHGKKTRSWSTVTPDMLPALWSAFGPEGPELVLATHGHPDHFSPVLWGEALRRWCGAVFISPEGDGRTIAPMGVTFRCRVGDMELEARRLPHEGREYADTPHWGYLISCRGVTVLHAGDCAVCAPELAEWLDGRRPDIAVLDFPWLTLSRGRRFTREVIRPEHLFLCHLPFAPDDTEGYRAAAMAAAAGETVIPDVRCLLEPFQRETI